MLVVRRMLWLIAFAFWQGGFMFYGAVVVPIGSSVLGSEQLQGFITRSVTNYLNIAGACAILLWGFDLVLSPDSSKVKKRLRCVLVLVLLVLLGTLVWLHARMDECLDLEMQLVLDRQRFVTLHIWYLNISTIQWLLSLALAGLTVVTWQEERFQNLSA